MTNEIANPYVGPRTFTREEGDRFFGRDREARELLSLVVSERLVLFNAQSGAGKSSLLNAKLIPRLEEEGFLVLPVGRVSGEVPEGVEGVKNIYVYNLMASLDQRPEVQGELAGLELRKFLAYLTTEDGEHYYYAPEEEVEEAEVGEQPPHLLVLDQFEEILTTNLDRWEKREGFFRQLNEAMRADELLWVVLTMREDYVAGLGPYARLLDGNLRARYYMKRMEAEAAREAVERPAEKGGIPFADGVAQSLVDNLRQIRVVGQMEEVSLGQYVEPVQLQVVCYQLWNNIKDRGVGAITQQDLAEMGDVDTTLAQYYNQAIAGLCRDLEIDERKVRNWFEQELITEALTRSTVYRGAEETEGMRNEIVQELEDEYLLRAERRAGGRWYELVHDRFVEPILKANRGWREAQGEVLMDAERWLADNKDPEKLYEGRQLRQWQREMKRREDPLPLVREFLGESDTAQKRKRRRRIFIGSGVVALILVGFVVLAVIASTAAENARLAEENYQQAEIARQQAEIAQEQAEELARQQEVVAKQAQDLAAALEEQKEAEEAAKNAALEAQAAAEENLRLAEEQQRLLDQQFDKAIKAAARMNVAFYDDLMAVTESEWFPCEFDEEGFVIDPENCGSSVYLYDLSPGQPEFLTRLWGHTDEIYDAALDASGILATVSWDGTLRLWDLNGQEEVQFDGQPFFVNEYFDEEVDEYYVATLTTVAFSPQGNYLVAGDDVGYVYLWDADGNQYDFPWHDGQIQTITFSPDERHMFVVTTPRLEEEETFYDFERIYHYSLENLDTIEPNADAVAFDLPRPNPGEAEGFDCSQPSEEQAEFSVVNNTDALIEVYWVDFSCQDQFWFSVNPGESVSQETFIGHLWAVYDVDGDFMTEFFVEEPGPIEVVVP